MSSLTDNHLLSITGFQSLTSSGGLDLNPAPNLATIAGLSSLATVGQYGLIVRATGLDNLDAPLGRIPEKVPPQRIGDDGQPLESPAGGLEVVQQHVVGTPSCGPATTTPCRDPASGAIRCMLQLLQFPMREFPRRQAARSRDR